MLLKDIYDEIGGDYKYVSERIPGEDLIRRFALMFTEDPSFTSLQKAIDEDCNRDAFRAVHSLKGVCANLGFEQLEKSAACLTELLREYEEKEIDPSLRQELFEQVKTDYDLVMSGLRKL